MSHSFNQEQKQYLEGFMAGIQQRGGRPYAGETAEGRVTSDPDEADRELSEEPDVYGTQVDDLSRQERIKYEQDPMEIWDLMEENARNGEFPEGDDVFRYKSRGLFYVAPAQDAYMMRCRIPGCMLTTRQLRGIATIGDRWGGGYADVTTRGNLQIREIGAEDPVRAMSKLYEIGLTSKGAGADNVRNVTATPTSGFDPEELYDVRRLALGMHHYILNSPDLYGLPRKFNIAFDSGGSISVASDTNDIGFVAVRVQEGADVEPGVYFRVRLGGVSGHRRMAEDGHVLVRPDETVAVGVAMLRVFIEHGDRTDRNSARLRYLLEDWGIPTFIEKVEERLTFDLPEVPRADCEIPEEVEKDGHVGVHPQAEDGLNYVGVVIPVGRMKVDQMRGLADLADEYGDSDVRLTIYQNALLPGIADEDVATVRRGLETLGLTDRAASVRRGLVACTGNAGCKYAMTETKGQALEIADHLEETVDLDVPINIHLTGCENSCAQHYCGDIGLLGMKTLDEDDERVEAYEISLGGGMDAERGIGREIVSDVPFSRVPELLEEVIATYMEERRDQEETFVEFTRSREVDELKDLFGIQA